MWKLGCESLPCQSCAVVVPADQPAKDTVNQRGEVAVAPLVIGEGCFGLGDGKRSMDWNKPVARDRDLARLVRLKVPVPPGFAAKSGDNESAPSRLDSL